MIALLSRVENYSVSRFSSFIRADLLATLNTSLLTATCLLTLALCFHYSLPFLVETLAFKKFFFLFNLTCVTGMRGHWHILNADLEIWGVQYIYT